VYRAEDEEEDECGESEDEDEGGEGHRHDRHCCKDRE
jgi:hypothetical protein